jgi:DNA-binding NarL/FixJ family response regulator
LEKIVFHKVADIAKLSNREIEIMIMLYKNHNAQMIADELVVARSTVNSHIKHIYMKLAVHSRIELVNLVDRTKADM